MKHVMFILLCMAALCAVIELILFINGGVTILGIILYTAYIAVAYKLVKSLDDDK